MKPNTLIIFIFTLLISNTMATKMIFDFHKEADTQAWRIINDTVMGGQSSSDFALTKEGHGRFKGHVSLANNGGFSSLRYDLKPLSVEDYTHISLKIKGDGKRYQFRVKAKASDYYSYIYYFETNGQWQTIKIPLNDMYPTFRGRTLDLPNFSKDTIEELGFLIGNKKEQNFQLLIDHIALQS